MSAARFHARIFLVLVLLLPPALADAQDRSTPSPPRLTGKRYADIDFGPATTLSLQVSPGNIAHKGIAIRLNPGLGGVSSGTEFVVFDSDTLRYAAGWTGTGFIDWKGIALDGQHNVHPSIVGTLAFENPVAPGWAHPETGSFEDVRVLGRDGRRYGPLPRDWAHWNGHYVHGARVVLSYSVGGVDILEMPGAEGPEAMRVMTRTLDIGPRKHQLVLQVAHVQDAMAELDDAGVGIIRGKAGGRDLLLCARSDGPAPAWIAAFDGHQRLSIPPGNTPIRVKVFLGSVPAGGSADAYREVVRNTDPPLALAQFTQGGPTHWTEKLITNGILGEGDGAYVIDDITAPDDNPYRAWLRFSGFDFFDDDRSLAISTWNGDVWIVDGLGETLENLTWQRIASGMFQPLGLQIVDQEIYVLCRDQITLLRDLNGDRETDFYENFNNDAQVTEHFHEFALDLQVAADGSFYYTKGARHAADAITPNHGTLIRVSRDGTESEIVARGFRAPNGLGIGPGGAFVVTDNQGHWTPANRINWVVPGGFYGYMQGYHERDVADGYDPPLCWVHPETDRSPGTVCWVPDLRWGPLGGKMLTVSYGMGQIFHVLHEEIDGVHQGGVVRFPLEFETGVMRAKFRPRDGQLYLAGLFGWSSNKTRPGGFYRVRYTGKRIYMPEDLHIASDGVVLAFTDPLDPTSATDLGNYAISHWNYAWTANYGSPDLRMDGSPGRDRLLASWAALSPDGRTVYLEIPGIREVMQMEILVNLNAADGTPVRHNLQNTIHRLGSASVRLLSGAGNTVEHESPQSARIQERPGLVQTLTTRDAKGKADVTDTRAVRLAATYVPEGRSPSPFLQPGPFTATWDGYLRLDLNEGYRFSFDGNGVATLSLNGRSVSWGETVALRQGLNPMRLAYQSPNGGEAEFRLYWESARMFRAPVPATAFVQPSSTPALEEGSCKRLARALIETHRCLRCHDAEGARPEFTPEAPRLDRAGVKFESAWLLNKIVEPRSGHPESTMPEVLRGPDSIAKRRQAADIVAYLVQRSAGHLLQPAQGAADAELGAVLYQEQGCVACHLLPEESDTEGLERFPLPDLGAKWREGALADFLACPERDYPATPMPNFHLTAAEAEALAAYLRTAQGQPASRGAFSAGDAHRGKALIETSGCLNCHALEGHASQGKGPDLSEILKSDLDEGCLADSTPSQERAPTLHLTEEEKKILREFLAEAVDSSRRIEPGEYAERKMRALNCFACHHRDGEGDDWSRLVPSGQSASDAAPTDEEFFAPQEPATIHATRPPLDRAGEKLNGDWMTAFIGGGLGYKPRPRLTARMPAFPAFAGDIAAGLAAQHGYGADRAPEPALDPGLVAAGQHLALSDDGFRCNACHGVREQLPLAGADTETINFAHIPERLRKEYYDRFVVDPQAFLPGTQMPQYADEKGNSTVPQPFDGDMRRQFDAVWEFMRSLGGGGTAR